MSLEKKLETLVSNLNINKKQLQRYLEEYTKHKDRDYFNNMEMAFIYLQRAQNLLILSIGDLR